MLSQQVGDEGETGAVGYGMKADRSLNMFTIFQISVKPFCHWVYEWHIFPELADNELLGCMSVVAADSQKWGYISRI